MKQLYTVKESAKILALAEGTIRNKISSGEIKAVKVLGATRIEKEELENLVRPIDNLK